MKVKTAYELAMERLGGSTEYSDALKKQLAEIDRRYEAKAAETRLAAEQQLEKKRDDSDKQEAIRKLLAEDLRRLSSRKEAEKDKVRKEADR